MQRWNNRKQLGHGWRMTRLSIRRWKTRFIWRAKLGWRRWTCHRTQFSHRQFCKLSKITECYQFLSTTFVFCVRTPIYIIRKNCQNLNIKELFLDENIYQPALTVVICAMKGKVIISRRRKGTDIEETLHNPDISHCMLAKTKFIHQTASESWNL